MPKVASKKPIQAVEQPITTSDSFQWFEDFARKLVNVPKEEVDAIDPLVQKQKKKRPAKQSK